MGGRACVWHSCRQLRLHTSGVITNSMPHAYPQLYRVGDQGFRTPLGLLLAVRTAMCEVAGTHTFPTRNSRVAHRLVPALQGSYLSAVAEAQPRPLPAPSDWDWSPPPPPSRAGAVEASRVRGSRVSGFQRWRLTLRSDGSLHARDRVARRVRRHSKGVLPTPHTAGTLPPTSRVVRRCPGDSSRSLERGASARAHPYGQNVMVTPTRLGTAADLHRSLRGVAWDVRHAGRQEGGSS